MPSTLEHLIGCVMQWIGVPGTGGSKEALSWALLAEELNLPLHLLLDK